MGLIDVEKGNLPSTKFEEITKNNQPVRPRGSDASCLTFQNNSNNQYGGG